MNQQLVRLIFWYKSKFNLLRKIVDVERNIVLL